VLDHPRAPEILDAVARLLREVILPQLPPQQQAAVFQTRVAANAVELAAREMRLGPPAAAAAQAQLQALLQRDGSLDSLQTALALQIRAGALDIDDPALKAHLWSSTLARLAVDQPAYAPYRHALQHGGGMPAAATTADTSADTTAGTPTRSATS
jgi:hypothetical protein